MYLHYEVEVILEQIEIKAANYYKPRCVSCNKKTIENVSVQNMPLSTGFKVNDQLVAYATRCLAARL